MQVSVVDVQPNITRDDLNNPKKGNFLFHVVTWIREPGDHETLRKVIGVCVAIFFSATVIGLLLVIPGIYEWNRQISIIRELNSIDGSNKLTESDSVEEDDELDMNINNESDIKNESDNENSDSVEEDKVNDNENSVINDDTLDSEINDNTLENASETRDKQLENDLIELPMPKTTETTETTETVVIIDTKD
jgi:UPF0716 family protein affecting phage T7 exclusion